MRLLALLLFALVAVPLLTTGCSTSFDGGGLAISAEDIVYGFVANGSTGVDTDDDGADDHTVKEMLIALTDREDFCSGGGSYLDFDDLLLVEVYALTTGEDFSVTANVPLADILLRTDAEQGYVGINVLHRQDGEVVARYASASLLGSEWLGGASLGLNQSSSSSGTYTSVSGDFDGILGADASDESTHDTDVNDDGLMDYREINESVSGSFFEASGCSSMETLLD